MIDDIYGFKLSPGQISNSTDGVLDELNEQQNRPLKVFCPFVFVDCIYVSMRTEQGEEQAVHVILGYDLLGGSSVNRIQPIKLYSEKQAGTVFWHFAQCS